MSTVRAWLPRVILSLCRPSAATATWTSSPATAMASRRMRVRAIGGSPRPARNSWITT